MRLHADGIAEPGGDSGLPNAGALASAIAQPLASFGGVRRHEDLAARAAAYLFFIARADAFAGGDKRVAARSALVLLDINGFAVPPDPALYDLVTGLVIDERTVEDAASYFRRVMDPRAPDPPP